MKFLNLKIENFLTVGEAEIDLADRGLVLIQGVNEDDTSAVSNGAGKSSIIDALLWCLHGVTARGRSGDGVVNRFAGKDCRVRLEIQDGAEIYSIARFRKHSLHKNTLLIVKTDAEGVKINMSKGTDKETQLVVQSILGCTPEVFNAAVVFSQEKMPDLPSMTDKQLKTIIEEAAGVEVLNAAYGIAKSEALAVQSKLKVETSLLTAAKGSLAGASANAAEMREQLEKYERSRADRARAILAEALPIKVDIGALKKEIEAVDGDALIAERDACTDKLDGAKRENEKLAKLTADEVGLKNIAIRIQERIENGKRELASDAKALQTIDEKIGKPCDECGKTYCEHDLETARKIAAATLEAKKEALRPQAALYRDAVTSAKTAQDSISAFRSSMTDVSKTISRYTEITKALKDFEMGAARIASKEKEIEHIKARAAVALKDTNPFQRALESAEKEISHLQEKVGLHDVNIAALGLDEILANEAVGVFGPAGVRALILDTVTPFLNECTREYLGVMSDANIHAVWSTLSKTAKGELREKFNIEVSNDKGDESFEGLSGGEKRKVRLATAMALQDLVASRASKPIEMLAADEIDQALDEAGLERLMGILERKARQRGTVLVISHLSLTDWIDQVVISTKSGGKSTLTGAVKHGRT